MLVVEIFCSEVPLYSTAPVVVLNVPLLAIGFEAVSKSLNVERLNVPPLLMVTLSNWWFEPRLTVEPVITFKFVPTEPVPCSVWVPVWKFNIDGFIIPLFVTFVQRS